MFDGNKVGAPAEVANANGVESGADMFCVLGVECGEGFDCGDEDLGRKRDFGFGRCERINSSDGSFVERDGEALLDIAFPEEFEDFIRMRRESKGGCSSRTVLLHNSFVIRHSDRVVFLDTVNEDLANSFQLVLPRQAKESGKSRVLHVLLEKE